MTRIAAFDWKRFFVRLYEKSIDADIFSRAAQVAFYFSFALFPLLYFLVSLFGMVLESSDGLKAELYESIRQVMPYSVFDLVRRTVDEIIENSTGGKATLGLVVTLWSSSAGVDAIRTALNSVYGIKETRPWPKTKLQSLVYTLIVTALAMLVLTTVFYGWELVQYGLAGMGLRVSSPLILVSIQWVSTLMIMLFACELIYNLLPNFKKRHWDWITAGSIVAIVLWIVLTSSFRLYLGFFNSYNKAYGSLGAVIIMMLWLYLTATALMIGGSINAVMNEMRDEEPEAEAKAEPEAKAQK